MKKIQKERGCAYLFIAHNLSMVKNISDQIGVMHLGHLAETGTTEEIFNNPIHPYTKSLLSAIPTPNPWPNVIVVRFTMIIKNGVSIIIQEKKCMLGEVIMCWQHLKNLQNRCINNKK